MDNSTIAIIPARAGSKGIINKNLINFCGKPLIAWSIEQAIKAEKIEEVYVTTDGEQIAETAEKFGARIIWRPQELSSDFATSESAIIHALEVLEKKEDLEFLVFLQATSPIRGQRSIDNAITQFRENNYDSLFSGTVLEDYCLWKNENSNFSSITYDFKNRTRRQDKQPLYLENGSIYIFKTDILKKTHNRLGGKIGIYEMPFEQSFEIDSYKDIKLCEYFMKKCMEEN